MPEIETYGFGRVTIDGREETRDVVDVEVLPTADAVRRYTQLDPRKTTAALHLTC